MGIAAEFKKFALRGNVVDLAVGIVIGGAFTKIVTAMVDKIIMPITGALTGGVDFSDRAYPVPVPGLEAADYPMIGWGALVQATLNFVIIAFAPFLVVKAMNTLEDRLQDESKPDPAPPPEDVRLLREIRDVLTSSESKPAT